jgi:hypothetical protein
VNRLTDGQQPWAGIVQAGTAAGAGWLPYVVVEDLDDAAERAVALAALDQPHVRPMDFTSRPMKGMVFVEPS